MKPMQLSHAFTGFLMDKEATGKSPYTLRNYRNTFKRVKQFLKGEDSLITEIDRTVWVHFFAWLQRQKLGGAATRAQLLSSKTIYNIYTNLSAFYSWAVSIDLVERNLIKAIERPDYQSPPVDPYTREEVDALLKVCERTAAWRNKPDVSTERSTMERDKAIIRLLLSTGIRASELCGITMGQIDLEHRSVMVNGKSRGRDPKTRMVYFGMRTRRSLWRYLATLPDGRLSDAPLFISKRGGPLTRHALYQLISRLGERAGIDDCKPHRFRHTFAINYLRNGGDVLTLQVVLGHTSLRMVRLYAKIAAQDCQRVHQKADPVDNWGL